MSGAFDAISREQDRLAAIRHDLHAHPELGLQEHRTADVVARTLESWGIEVHRGIGQTGVVGVLRAGAGNRALGLRADMDALPIHEVSDKPYKSTTPGTMHACGHDGHTTMLLGAAQYLAATKRFSGTVHFIFQPGEEGAGGALAMLDDKLFERFPCDAIYGLHNRPGLDVGVVAVRDGVTMAGGAFFDITIDGKGAHGAYPENGIDPVITACTLATALQTIVSRNVSPSQPAVVSVTKIHGGDAYNVIPQRATLSGTARFFSRETGELMRDAMQRLADGVAAGFGATASVQWGVTFAPTVNAAEPVAAVRRAAAALVGDERLVERPAVMGSEDFAFMMEKVDGAYFNIGNGGGPSVHHPEYDFNDAAIPYGAAMFAELVERELAG